MDPIAIIVAALTAGATGAAQNTLGAAATDAYNGLKALIRRRLSGSTEVEADLQRAERHPEADQSGLEARLGAAGSGEDAELLEAARALLEEVDPGGSRAGKYDVTVTGGKGVTVGDHNTVTMTFDDGA